MKQEFNFKTTKKETGPVVGLGLDRNNRGMVCMGNSKLIKVKTDICLPSQGQAQRGGQLELITKIATNIQ